MELIAHRAGNERRLIAPALTVTDTIELDVHWFGGRLEVRHAKVLWPLRRFWERWEWVATPDGGWHELSEIVEHAPDGAHLWIDLKGLGAGLGRRALDVAGERRPLTVSSRAWWVLRAARRRHGIRTFRSVGTTRQRWLARHVRYGPLDGVVMHQRLADPASVARLRACTDHVVVWAVDDLGRGLDLAAMGVTGIIADDLELLRSLVIHLSRTTSDGI